MVFSTELSELRLATYWDAMCDLSVDGIEWACAHAVMHFQPSSEHGRLPVPALLREYVKESRVEKLQRAEAAAAHLLPQWSETPDHVGLEAIRKVLDMLGDALALKHDVYQRPSTDDPEARKALLIEQAKQVMQQTPNGQQAKEVTREP